MRIRVERLTDEGFAPFGRVLGRPAYAEPTVADAVADSWLGISDLMGIGATPGKQITFLYIDAIPPAYDKIERHDTSAEAFIPLEGQSILLVVPAGANSRRGQPDMKQARAFLLDGSQGILMRPGTWHAVPYKLSDIATFIVLVDDAIIAKQDLHVTAIEPVEFVFS